MKNKYIALCMLIFVSHASCAMHESWSQFNPHTSAVPVNKALHDQLLKAQQHESSLLPFLAERSDPVPSLFQDFDPYNPSLSFNDGSSWQAPAAKKAAPAPIKKQPAPADNHTIDLYDPIVGKQLNDRSLEFHPQYMSEQSKDSSLNLNPDQQIDALPAEKQSNPTKATLQESIKHKFDAAQHVAQQAMNIPVKQIYALYQQLPDLKTRAGREKFKTDASAIFIKLGTSAPTAQDFARFFASIKENMSFVKFKNMIMQLFLRTNKNAEILQENSVNFGQH